MYIYSDFLEEIKNVNNSSQFKKYMSCLEGEDYDINNIFENAQNGWCEDFAVYFYVKYQDVDIKYVGGEHFVLEYKNKYYDSKTLDGSIDLHSMEFFLKNNIKDFSFVHWTILELPRYYYKAFLECELINQDDFNSLVEMQNIHIKMNNELLQIESDVAILIKSK